MKLTALLFGGTPQEFTFTEDTVSVQQLRSRMNLPTSYIVTVDGEPASDDSTLHEGNFVAFSPAIKGG